MNRLVICASCARHVRATQEPAPCPFCDAIVDAAAPPRGAAIASSRAARYARNVAVATGIVAATACGSSDTTGGGPDASAEGGRDAGADQATSGDDSGGGGGDDASDDALADGAPEDVVSDRVCCPPYGCVFPDACGSVIA